MDEIDRTGDKVFSCTTDVVRTVIELNRGASFADSTSLVQYVTVSEH